MWPLGFVTGSAVPGQNVAEADALGDADDPESTSHIKPVKAADKMTEKASPEETLGHGVPEAAAEEENTTSQPEAGPDRLGVRSPPAGKLNLDLSLLVGLHASA